MRTDPRVDGVGSPGEDLRRRAVFAWNTQRDGVLARELVELARSWATEHGDIGVWQWAEASRCAFDPARAVEEDIRNQRKILMATADTVTSAIAANNLSCLFCDSEDPKRALFYASLNVHHAGTLDDPGLLAAALNQVGNVHLAATRLDEAAAQYIRALDCLPLHPVDRATLLDNLGYCRLLDRRFTEGVALLRASLQHFVRGGRAAQECLTRLSLCQAHLELRRSRAALEHGLAALELARWDGNDELLRHALFLAGEAHASCGHENSAHDLFSELAADHFPELPWLADVLVVVETQGMLNLRV